MYVCIYKRTYIHIDSFDKTIKLMNISGNIFVYFLKDIFRALCPFIQIWTRGSLGSLPGSCQPVSLLATTLCLSPLWTPCFMSIMSFSSLNYNLIFSDLHFPVTPSERVSENISIPASQMLFFLGIEFYSVIDIQVFSNSPPPKQNKKNQQSYKEYTCTCLNQSFNLLIWKCEFTDARNLFRIFLC